MFCLALRFYQSIILLFNRIAKSKQFYDYVLSLWQSFKTSFMYTAFSFNVGSILSCQSVSHFLCQIFNPFVTQSFLCVSVFVKVSLDTFLLTLESWSFPVLDEVFFCLPRCWYNLFEPVARSELGYSELSLFSKITQYKIKLPRNLGNKSNKLMILND